MFVAVNLRTRGHEHVLGKTQPAQTAVCPLHPPDGLLAAVADNDHEIHVAVLGRRAPGVRTEQINLLRLKFGFQPFYCFVQQAFWNGLHGFQPSIAFKF